MFRNMSAAVLCAAATTSVHAADQDTRHIETATTLPSVLVEDQAVDADSVSSSATRTETPLQQTPQSVQVISRSLIDDQQAVTLSEALRNASAVNTNASFSTPAFETTRIRGFAAEQFVDGFTQFYNGGDRESLINIDRIEVLKGANAVLYGGGAGSPVGGIVQLITKQPEADASRTVGVKLGSNAFLQPFFDVNQPLAKQLQLRATGEYTHAETNIDVIKQQRYNINPAIRYQISDKTQIMAQARSSRWEQQEYQGLPATGTITGDFRIRPSLFIGNSLIPDSRSENDSLTLTFEHAVTDHWQTAIKARVGRTEFAERAQSIYEPTTFDFTANRPIPGTSTWGLGNLFLTQEQKERSGVAESRYRINTEHTRHTVLIGADFSRLEDVGFLTFADTGTVVDLRDPVFSAAYQEPPKSALTTIQDGDITNETRGVFVQLQSTIGDHTHLLLGLRQARVSVDYTEATLEAFGLPTRQVARQTRYLPRVGLVQDLSDSIALFANYSEGLRGQPFAVFAPGVRPSPAESDSQEAGMKFRIGDRVSGQLAAFEINRSKVVVGFPGEPIGEQRSRGVDGDVTIRLKSAWELLVSYAHLDTEFTRAASAGVEAGNSVNGVPDDAARVWLSHDFSVHEITGLNAGVGLSWQSSVYIDNANQFRADGFTTLDAAVQYQRGNLSMGLTVKNLSGRDYFQYYEYFGGRVRPDDGTPVYVSLAYNL